MSDPVIYLQAMDAAACSKCDTRQQLEAEIKTLRKRRDDLLQINPGGWVPRFVGMKGGTR